MAQKAGLAFRAAERQIDARALDGIADGAAHQVTVAGALDQIILSALAQGLHRQHLVVGAGQHDHGNQRPFGLQSGQRRQPEGIGQ